VLEQMSQMMLRVREIAVESANGVYSDAKDRNNMDTEVQSLLTGIAGLATNAKYNGIGLLSGDANSKVNIQFSDETAGTLALDASALDFKTAATMDVTTATTANAAIALADTEMDSYAAARATFASASVTLGYQSQAQAALAEALDTARSRIEDTDYAQETGNMTRNQILQQAATAALAQANAMPNSILSLIK